VHGLHRDSEGRWCVDLRWQDRTTGERMRLRERLVLGVSEEAAREYAAQLIAKAYSGALKSRRALARRPRDHGFIYAIHGGGLTKFGWAKNPDARLKDLQRGSPVTLSIVARREGSCRQEFALHRRLAEHRVHGEWFAVNAADAVRLLSEAA
jgi:hypothetical protein